MNDSENTEACGRCSMSTVVDATETNKNPFSEERIEIAEHKLRWVSPSAWLTGIRNRLDHWAWRLMSDNG
jgi:hypothetical protein